MHQVFRITRHNGAAMLRLVHRAVGGMAEAEEDSQRGLGVGDAGLLGEGADALVEFGGFPDAGEGVFVLNAPTAVGEAEKSEAGIGAGAAGDDDCALAFHRIHYAQGSRAV